MAESEAYGRRAGADLPEGVGDRLLARLLDRAHEAPPQLVVPLVDEVVQAIGGRDLTILLRDYGQIQLVPLPRPDSPDGVPVLIEGTPAGEALLRSRPVEEAQPDGVRVHLPLSDGSGEAGVMALTLDGVGEGHRRLLRRLAGVVAGTLAAKNGYTDRFFQLRRRQPMTVAAEIQWSLLPPLSMRTPQVAVAGILEPAYEIAGDSLDYALNDDILHMAVIDAMGHGLNAAVMATVAVGAYRHARRAEVGLAGLYAFMDSAISEQFAPDHFVTAQMMRLNTTTGRLEWVNAGHPAPLLIRGHRVLHPLEGPGTLPVGFGGATPQVNTVQLRLGDRVMFYTDGLVEEHGNSGVQFGEARLIEVVERVGPAAESMREMARGLSQALLRERGGVTTDDATLFLAEWRGSGVGLFATPVV